MTDKPTVHIVHCVDTEGPLYESLPATFERLREIFDVDLEATPENLRRVQNREINLGGLEDEVAKVLSPVLLAYNSSWDQIDEMLRHIMSREYREAFQDSFGNGWVFNWHCLDFVGFSTNPRRRDMGFHNIFDHYREVVRLNGSTRDGIHFHHHPVPFSGEGHRPATHYFSHKPVVFEILARRIIDRQWFPCVNRPGFHTIRPDSHWLLEQSIPFDFANQATAEDYSSQQDLPVGRFGDWRRAPRTWTPYHPAHDDYETEGSCRRWIARCLNIGGRCRLLTEEDVDQAFAEAKAGKPVVLAFTNHDFRDIRPAIDTVRGLIGRVSARYPSVAFRFCEAREAMRRALKLELRRPLMLTLSLEGNRLLVETDAPTFGPQPFLAIKTKSGQYFHDNLDFHEPFRVWSYIFDGITVPLDGAEAIGVGACDATGNVTTVVLKPGTGEMTQSQY